MMSSKRSVILSKFIFGRCFHTTQIRRIDPKTVEEIKIPVPWGHIAGKWWGKKNVQPVIAVHGWQDNAGSWDPMAELMPDDFSILALDLPGNGRSSNLPPLHSYFFKDTVGLLRRIKRHFGWDRLDILGHSGGSAVCFLYAAVFPEDIRSYFGIDYLTYCYIDENERAANIGGLVDKNIELALRDHASSRRYTEDELVKIWIKGTDSSLNDQTARILMKRGAIKMPDGRYMFSRDQRLKMGDLNEFNVMQNYAVAKNISCHIRLVRGTRSAFFNKGIKHCPDILNIIKQKAKSYKFYDMDGNHHLHMDIPEEIVPLFVELLNQK